MNAEFVYRHLPNKIRRAVIDAEKFCDGPSLELHICRGSGSSVRFLGGKIYLGVNLSQSDMDCIFSSLTGGALYAHRDSIREGYISFDGGIRVGVCGQARYEGDAFVGVFDISSILIRVPCDELIDISEVCDAFMRCKKGMLIFAPACGGKTTALRALIKRLSAIGAGRISLIDERREIDRGDFSTLDVDVFSGYRRADGMRIALRVMSPEILAVDEIGTSSESRDMLESLLSGVKFLATAHGRELAEVRKRENLKAFFELDIFDAFVRISSSELGFKYEIL